MTLINDIRTALLIAAAAVLLLVGFLTGAPPARADERPNFVVIQTDDQSPQLLDSLYRGKDGIYRRTMPNTLREVFRSGTEFRNYYTTSPVCSPSRASLLSGQYPQNNNLLTNSGELGGWLGWRHQEISENNLPLTLKRAGYRTSHFGKFMNSYFDLETGEPTLDRPRGWSRWFTASFKSKDNRFYGYSVNDDGRLRGPFGNPQYKSSRGIDPAECELSTPRVKVYPKKPKVDCNYTTDLFTRKAVRDLGRGTDKPFYLQIGYDAPHGDVRPPVGPQPATRHIGKASRTPLAKSPSFNEANLSDKPELIRQAAPRLLDRSEKFKLKTAYQRQLESLMAVDEGVGAIVKALRRSGELDNTYIFFVSDHGFFLGEHRFSLAKFLPYEESSSVSMAVRGPGVPVGKSGEVVGNIDIPATISEIAGVDPEYEMDGRSMRSFWEDRSLRSSRPLGISLRKPATAATVSARAPSLRYRGYRVGPYKLIRYWNDESELYDLRVDPYELRNRYDDPDYVSVRQYLDFHYEGVIDCVAAGCRQDLPAWPEPALP